MRKKIGVLLGQLDESTQMRFMLGFIREAYAYDMDVCVFSMYQKYQLTELRDIGESNIFELIPYDMYDAFVILLDTILTPGKGEELEQQLKRRSRGPVLVVDQNSAYFDTVMMDHYTPVVHIIDHLIEEHGYTDIAFLGGKEGHIHSVQRLQAFYDSMSKHGLEVGVDRVYHGNYWYDSGEAFGKILMKDREHLPQAVACANDHMAIGLIAYLEEQGVHVPEDIAVTGYDSVEDGRHSPIPLTSADIPAGECGSYCVQWLIAKLENQPVPEFSIQPRLVHGGTCGCEWDRASIPSILRKEWKTESSSRGFYSEFNHLLEDMLSQTDYGGFFYTVMEYSHQIRPFHSFHLCMNEKFMVPESNLGERAIRKGYADRMVPVFSCTENPEENRLNFVESFDTRLLLPQMHEERDYPTTYVFNPVYFDDRCFGYTVINYGREIYLGTSMFRIWMLNVMQGMEAFFRQQSLKRLLKTVQSTQIRDSLTGMYNYQGFIQQADALVDICKKRNVEICVIALDIKGFHGINEVYGRKSGDRTLRSFGRYIQESLADENNEICCRLSNDEFLIALLDWDGAVRVKAIIDSITEKCKTHIVSGEAECGLYFHYVSINGSPDDAATMESLVNYTVAKKNRLKSDEHRNEFAQERLSSDEIQRNKLVEKIMEENLINYNFQPIVRAKDGSIYAYEALMRCDAVEHITIAEIMQAAESLGRMYDIEKMTMFTVMEYLNKHHGDFGDTKVFINSLPGYQLTGEDARWVQKQFEYHAGHLVVELIESSEMDDEKLEELRERYDRMKVEIALDDYGSGYSNANNLLRYRPRYVKIDRMLITDIQHSPQKQHFVRNIVDYSHQNEILALAEGVENSEELRAVINMDVDLIQGFFIAKPEQNPVEKVPKEIREEIKRYQSQRETVYDIYREN
ncbi:MAG: EAL domain-containing protein [Acetatifactor sp.]